MNRFALFSGGVATAGSARDHVHPVKINVAIESSCVFIANLYRADF
jgi:hypothetical protein